MSRSDNDVTLAEEFHIIKDNFDKHSCLCCENFECKHFEEDEHLGWKSLEV